MSYTPLNDTILSGDARAVSPTAGDNDTSIATTAFVQGELGNYLPLDGGTMTGNITLDTGVDIDLAADSALSWDGGAASLSYNGVDGVLSSDVQIRVSAAPSDDADLANKGYVDSVAMGLDVKASVRVASQADVTIASPGASIDGVTLANGNRVLLKAQAAGEENGIYVFNGAAVPMTRAMDADSDAEVTAGMFTFIEEGTNADQGWVLTTDNPIDLGVTELVFSQFSNAVIVSTIDSLTDVDVAGAVSGSALIFDGMDWVDSANVLLDDANSKITLGADTNLYRGAADQLKTDDDLWVDGGSIVVDNIGTLYLYTDEGVSSEMSQLGAAGLTFTDADADTSVIEMNAKDLRLSSAAGDVKVDDDLRVTGDAYIGAGERHLLDNGAELESNGSMAVNGDLFVDNAGVMEVHLDRGVDTTSASMSASQLTFTDSDGDAVSLSRDVKDIKLNSFGGNIVLGDPAEGIDVLVEKPLEAKKALRFSAISAYSANATLSEIEDHIALVDSSGGAVTITLPPSPSAGQIYQIKDAGGACETNNITIDGNGKNIDGAVSVDMGVNYQSATVLYDGTADAWFLI